MVVVGPAVCARAKCFSAPAQVHCEHRVPGRAQRFEERRVRDGGLRIGDQDDWRLRASGRQSSAGCTRRFQLRNRTFAGAARYLHGFVRCGHAGDSDSSSRGATSFFKARSSSRVFAVLPSATDLRDASLTMDGTSRRSRFPLWIGKKARIVHPLVTVPSEIGLPSPLPANEDASIRRSPAGTAWSTRVVHSDQVEPRTRSMSECGVQSFRRASGSPRRSARKDAVASALKRASVTDEVRKARNLEPLHRLQKVRQVDTRTVTAAVLHPWD